MRRMTAADLGGSDERRGSMSHPRNRFVVGDRHVIVSTEQGLSVSAAKALPSPARRLVLPPLPPLGDEPIGREEERAALGLMIAPGEPVQIRGPDGIGKSTLLRRLAHDVADRGEPVVHIRGAGRELDDVLQDLFEAWFDGSGYAPSRTRLRELLGGISAVLLVDDLDCPPGRLREFLETGPGIALVFTSASGQSPADRTVELGGLGRRAAFGLLARELGRPLQREEIPAATSLWETTGGGPLELIRAAAASMTPEGRLGDGPVFGSAVPFLYARLGRAERDVLALFAALPSAPVSEGLLAEVAGTEGAAEAAGRLVRLGLLTEEPSSGGRRYRLAPGVGGLLPAEAAPGAEALEALTARVTGWARAPGTSASALSAHAGLLTGLTTVMTESRPDLAVRLARAAAPAMAGALRWGAWRELLDAGLAAAERAGDERAVAYFTHERGVHMLAKGATGAAAALAAAALLWRELGDSAGAAITTRAQAAMTAPPASVISGGPGAAARGVHAAAGAGGTGAGPPGLAGTVTGLAARALAIKTGLAILGAVAAGAGAVYVVPPVIQMIKERPRTVGCANVAPGQLGFSGVAVSAVRQVQVSNTCPRSIASVASSVSDPRFAVVGDTCAGHPLPPKGTCLISVRFTPAGVGRAKAVLRVVAGNTTGQVTLLGEAPPTVGGPATAGEASERSGGKGRQPKSVTLRSSGDSSSTSSALAQARACMANQPIRASVMTSGVDRTASA